MTTPPRDPQRNPWTKLSSELRYDNAWIAVTEHQVINPSGGRGIYGTVHFKHTAIGIVVLDEERNTWLVGQYRYPLGRYSWEIPEGGGDHAAGPLLSAQRELREETGIEARHWKEILRLDLSNSITDETAVIYLATGLEYGEAAPEETEQLELRRLPFGEACAMALDGRITDAISVAGLLRVRLMLDAGEL